MNLRPLKFLHIIPFDFHFYYFFKRINVGDDARTVPSSFKNQAKNTGDLFFLMEETVTDPMTGEEYIQMVNVPQSVLQQLQAVAKIDVTPKGVYDRYAMERTMENFLMNGFFNPQRVAEFEAYVKALPDDSVAPKQDLLEGIENIKKTQMQIAQIDAQAKLMQQKAQQFLMGDPDGQAEQISEAQLRMLEEQYANMATEKDNDNYDYNIIATQADFDDF